MKIKHIFLLIVGVFLLHVNYLLFLEYELEKTLRHLFYQDNTRSVLLGITFIIESMFIVILILSITCKYWDTKINFKLFKNKHYE